MTNRIICAALLVLAGVGGERSLRITCSITLFSSGPFDSGQTSRILADVRQTMSCIFSIFSIHGS